MREEDERLFKIRKERSESNELIREEEWSIDEEERWELWINEGGNWERKSEYIEFIKEENQRRVR